MDLRPGQELSGIKFKLPGVSDISRARGRQALWAIVRSQIL